MKRRPARGLVPPAVDDKGLVLNRARRRHHGMARDRWATSPTRPAHARKKAERAARAARRNRRDARRLATPVEIKEAA